MDHIHTFFYYTRTWRASPDEWSAQCRGHLRDSTNMKDNTHQAHDIRGPCGPKIFWHLSYRWGKTPKKTSHRKLVLNEDRTRVRCVTAAHATACSTAVDTINSCWEKVHYISTILTFNVALSIKINPWRCSPEELRPTEAVAAWWQYRGLVGIKAPIPLP